MSNGWSNCPKCRVSLSGHQGAKCPKCSFPLPQFPRR